MVEEGEGDERHVEHVPPVAKVLSESKPEELEEHLECERRREEPVDNVREDVDRGWLVVPGHRHREHVKQHEARDETLKRGRELHILVDELERFPAVLCEPSLARGLLEFHCRLD